MTELSEQEIKLKCLKMALENCGNTSDSIRDSEVYYDFILNYKKGELNKLE